MTKPRTIAAIAITLLAGALVGGCGGSSKSDYAQQVREILQPLGSELQSLGPALSSAGDKQGVVDALNSVEDEIDGAVSELDSIDVPDGVEQVNDDLVAAISGFGDELAKIGTAAEQGDSEQLQSLAAALPAIATDFQTELSRVQDAAIEAGVPIDTTDGE